MHTLSDVFKIRVEAINCSHDALIAFAESGLKLKVYPRAPVEVAKPKIEPVVVEELIAPALLEVPSDIVEVAEVTDNSTDTPANILVESPSLGDNLNQASQSDSVLTLKKSLRSGQKVRHAGDVVVYGDINAGAEVLAGGNIIILGSLRGLAHAGARGDDGATIVAFDFRPTQLRIGRKFAEPTEWSPRLEKSYSPSIASVHGGEVIVEAYSGQSHR
jgi:septum site-determining protein MinC